MRFVCLLRWRGEKALDNTEKSPMRLQGNAILLKWYISDK